MAAFDNFISPSPQNRREQIHRPTAASTPTLVLLVHFLDGAVHLAQRFLDDDGRVLVHEYSEAPVVVQLDLRIACATRANHLLHSRRRIYLEKTKPFINTNLRTKPIVEYYKWFKIPELII